MLSVRIPKAYGDPESGRSWSRQAQESRDLHRLAPLASPLAKAGNERRNGRDVNRGWGRSVAEQAHGSSEMMRDFLRLWFV